MSLPDGSLLLHIGPQKTGSTAMQRAMHQSRAAMAASGVHYPGPHYRMPAEAGYAVLGRGSAVGRKPPRMAAWQAVLDDLAGNSLPRACLSSEGLGLADDAAAARVVKDLTGVVGADRVHLVWVARRIDKLLPSHWQERVKARLAWSWPEFLERTCGPDPDTGSWEYRMMWGPQDPAAIIDRWAQHVDRSRITVIVADEGDRGVLPRAFEDLLGLPTGLLDPPPDRSNRSLTYVEAEAVRRVNQVFADEGWTPEQYWRIVQAGVAESLKNSPAPTGAAPIPGLTGSVIEAVHDRADAQADAIASAGVTVVGDPEVLRTRDRVRADDDPLTIDAVSPELLGTIVTGLVSGALDLQRRTLRQGRAVPRRTPFEGVPSRQLATELRGRVVRRLSRRAR